MNNNYVIYRIDFPNGCYYIGKAVDYRRRMNQHKKTGHNIGNLKVSVVAKCGTFTAKVLYSAPDYLSDDEKQIYIDNLEKMVIHDEARKVYNLLTGEQTNYRDYHPYRGIVNKILVNTQLY